MPTVLLHRSVSVWTFGFTKIAELILCRHDQFDRQSLDRSRYSRPSTDRVVEILGKQRVRRDRTGDQDVLGPEPVLGIKAFPLRDDRGQETERRGRNADTNSVLSMQAGRSRRR